MATSSLMGGDGAEQEQEPAIEYTALAASPLINGEVKLVFTDNALMVTSLFDAREIMFAEMNDLSLLDYRVTVRADSGDFVFSKMGSWCQPFYDALCDAYNQAVLRSLFVKDTPLLTVQGNYRYVEQDVTSSGKAFIHVHGNSIVALPPDLGARRVPLCFVDGLDKGDYELTLSLDTQERYSFAKLGYDTDPFYAAIERQLHLVRENSLRAVRELDPSLTGTQASQIARLMPQGSATAIGQLSAISPSFVKTLESLLAKSRIAQSYTTFLELCDPDCLYIGFKKNESAAEDAPKENEDASNEQESEDAAEEAVLLWLIAPSPDGQYAAVEFAEANTATFVYRTRGDFAAFARQMNRSLEAIDFKREVIRLSDEELLKPDNADYYMAAKRTAALRFVRSNFVKRIIHSSAESWKRKLMELWAIPTQ